MSFPVWRSLELFFVNNIYHEAYCCNARLSVVVFGWLEYSSSSVRCCRFCFMYPKQTKTKPRRAFFLFFLLRL